MMERPDRWCSPLWQAKAPRARLTVLPWIIWSIVIVASIFLPVRCAQGAPFARSTSSGGVVIDLDSDPCALPSLIVSLPKRATWTENGKVTEGCFGVDPKRGLVILYFEDKTIVILELGYFSRLVAA